VDDSHAYRQQTERMEKNITVVGRSVERDPNESIRHRASSLGKILRKDLSLARATFAE